MAVNYVKGQILSSILERDGIDISIANANVGIGTVSPSVKLEVAGNVILGNLSTAGNVATGNLLTDNLLYANGTPWDLQQPAGNNTEIQFNNNSQFGANVNFTFDTAANLLTVNATANIANLNVAGNVVGGNILTGGAVSATGNVTAGNVSTAGNVYATNFIGNISGNLNAPGANTEVIFNDAGTANAVPGFTFDKTSNAVAVIGNITAGNILTLGSGGDITLTGGNITGANVITANAVSVTGNITSGNIAISGLITATGNVTGGNLLSSGDIQAVTANLANLRLANTTITTDSTIGNIVLEPTSTGVVYINTTTGLIIPVGNTLQRPSPATQGTVRFNTTTSRVEVYDGSEWDTIVGGVTNQILNGDGSTLTFVLDRSTTTAAVLVILNGITQVPTQAYNMSPNPSVNLVFTEAPDTGDVIDIRFL
jgi:hypothetical protein